MRLRRVAILVVLTALPVVAVAADPPATSRPDVPLVFARSGDKATITIQLVNLPSMQLSLQAFGRTWAKATARDDKNAFRIEFDAPAVRVPTVFAVTPAELTKPVLAELVVYPDRPVDWDKSVTLYACGAPAWFDQWSAATGLPVKQVAITDLPAAKLKPADEKTQALLILGAMSAWKDLADVGKLAESRHVNVLVLDAAWFGQAAGPVNVAPSQMHQGLSEVGKQRWSEPLKFTSHRQPWPGIANRWAWMLGETGLPLVEAFCFTATHWEVTGNVLDARASEPRQAAVLSYLPWERQIGRSESADAALLELIRASARATKPEMRDVETSLVDPPEGLNLKDRPILSAAVMPPRAAHGVIDPKHQVDFVKVVDLRGKDAPVKYLETQQQSLREFVEHSEGRGLLLILGDDKMLDDWKWLKLDRDKKRIGAANVQWLPDDELPPSKEQQIRLMLKLTELGVPLGPPQHKETGK